MNTMEYASVFMTELDNQLVENLQQAGWKTMPVRYSTTAAQK